jgi:hypothetical protein
MCQTIVNGTPDPQCPGQTRVLLNLRQPVDLFHSLKTVKGFDICLVYDPPQKTVTVFGYIERSFWVIRTVLFNTYLCNHVLATKWWWDLGHSSVHCYRCRFWESGCWHLSQKRLCTPVRQIYRDSTVGQRISIGVIRSIRVDHTHFFQVTIKTHSSWSNGEPMSTVGRNTDNSQNKTKWWTKEGFMMILNRDFVWLLMMGGSYNLGFWWETVVLFWGRWYRGREEKTTRSMVFELCSLLSLLQTDQNLCTTEQRDRRTGKKWSIPANDGKRRRHHSNGMILNPFLRYRTPPRSGETSTWMNHVNR